MAHTFVVGADLFDFANDDWGLVKRKLANQISNGVASDGGGEFWPESEESFDEKQEITLTYRAKVKTDALDVAISLGLACTSGYIPLSIKVNTKGGSSPGHAEVEITGHKHGSSTHEVNSIDVACTVDGWGATDFCSAVADDGCQSGSWSASINHKDSANRKGDFLCGRSQGCKVDVAGQYISDTAPALDTDYTDDGSDLEDGDDFWTAALKGHLYLRPA
jgi:hypothetical protein